MRRAVGDAGHSDERLGQGMLKPELALHRYPSGDLRIDVDQRDDGAREARSVWAIRTNRQGIVMAVPVPDLMLLGSGLRGASDGIVGLLQADVPTNVAERPPDIARDQIHHSSRG